MSLSDSQLDQLFEGVRKEKPVASFEETQKAFLKATIVASGGALATKGILKLLNFKQWIMMISVLSVLTTGTLLITLNSSPVEPKNNASNSVVPSEELKTPEKESEKEQVESEELATLQELNNKLSVLSEEPLEITIDPGKPPVEVRAYLKGDGTYHFVYVITSETTLEDLKELQEKARQAGIELVCEPDFNDNKLRRLNMSIIQKTGNGQSSNIQISDINLEETPEYSVAWNVDDEGTATTIACGEPTESEDIEKLLAELNLDGMTEEMERIMEEYESEIKVIMDDNRNEIEAYADELAMVENLLENESMQKILKELEVVSEEEMEEIMDELEEALEELGDYEINVVDGQTEIRTDCCSHGKNCDEGYHNILDELIKDELIKDKARRVKMQINDDKVKVNGTTLTGQQKEKYLALVSEYFEVDFNDHEGRWTWVYSD